MIQDEVLANYLHIKSLASGYILPMDQHVIIQPTGTMHQTSWGRFARIVALLGFLVFGVGYFVVVAIRVRLDLGKENLVICVVALVNLFWWDDEPLARCTLFGGFLLFYLYHVYERVVLAWTWAHVDLDGSYAELVQFGALLLYVLFVEQFARKWL